MEQREGVERPEQIAVNLCHSHDLRSILKGHVFVLAALITLALVNLVDLVDHGAPLASSHRAQADIGNMAHIVIAERGAASRFRNAAITFMTTANATITKYVIKKAFITSPLSQPNHPCIDNILCG